MYQWFEINSTTYAVGKREQSRSPMITINETQQFDASLISSDHTIVGPYSDENPMPSSYRPVWNNPRAYLYQNDAFTDNPDWTSIQLQQAQQNQIEQINSGLNATLIGGFTSKTTTHTYVTTTNGQTNMEGELKRFELDSTLTSVQFYTIDKSWLAHSHQDLINAFLDGGKWKDAQYAQAQNLINQVNTLVNTPGTTVTQIQAVVWTPAATY